jgi:uncharacterized repeat protein (TIGR01451 family)
VSPYDPRTLVAGEYISDASTAVQVTFTVDGDTAICTDNNNTPNDTTDDTGCSVVLAWGGHIASTVDWGLDNGAVNISGSPFHMRQKVLYVTGTWTDANGDDFIDNGEASVVSGIGNQDRALASSAVIFPGSITIEKIATPPPLALDPTRATEFVFTFTGPEPVADLMLENGETGSSGALLHFGEYTVTEVLPADWQLTAIECSVNEEDPTPLTPTLAFGIDVQEGDNVSCTVTNIAELIDLELDKSVFVPTPFYADSSILTFTVTVTNDSTSVEDAGFVAVAATNVTVEDVLPDGYSYVSDTPSQGSLTGNIWTLGTLGPDAVATLNITATANTSGPFDNIAQVETADQEDLDSRPGNDDPAEDDQASVGVTAPQQVFDLTISKTVSDDIVSPGDLFSYTITVTNDGPSGASNVEVVDTLPLGVTFVSTHGEGIGNGCVAPNNDPDGVPNCSLGGIGSGQSKSYIITVTVDTGASGTLTNTAIVSSLPPDQGPLTNEASAFNTVVNPVLTLLKSTTTTTYSAVGDLIDYSYLVTNTGNVTLAEPVTIADDKTTATCAPSGDGDLDVGETVICTAVDYAVTQADIDAGSVTNIADATADGTTSNESSVTVNATEAADILLVKFGTPDFSLGADPLEADLGDVINYTFTVTNTGNVTLTDVLVTDPEVLTITCPSGNPIPTLLVGATEVCTGSYSITQDDLNAGHFRNDADATGTSPTFVEVSDEDFHDETIPQDPELTLVKTGSTDLFSAAGQLIEYTFLVTNTGNVTISGPITIDDVFVGPAAEFPDDAACPDLTTVGDLDNVLDVGEAITCTASHTTTLEDRNRSTIENTATATGTDPAGDPVISNPDTWIVAWPPEPVLSILKTGTFLDESGDGFAQVGETIAYTFEVSNLSNVILTNVVVSDPDIPVISCPSGNPTVFDPIQELLPWLSETCTGSYSITQEDIDTGFKDNTATATADCVDLEGVPFCATDTDDETTTLPQFPELTLLKTARTFADTNGDGLAGGAGDLVTYDYTVTNTGTVTLIDVTLADDNGTPGVPGDDLTPTLVGLTDEDADTFDDDLAPLAFATATATHEITEGEFIFGTLTNIAIATGTSPTGTVFDDDTVTVEFPLPPLDSCDLEVTKSCCVMPPPSANGGTDCEGKVVEAIFRYTGEDCSATTNDQGGKLKCVGVIGGGNVPDDPINFPNQYLEPVDVVVQGKGADKVILSTSSDLYVDQMISFSHVDGNLRAHTEFDVIGPYGGVQTLKIHTSCSKPLNVGDQFGSMQLIRLTSTEGGIVTLPDGNELTACVTGGDPAGTSCDSRLTEAVFKYDVTGTCENPLANPQGGKATCADGDALVPADIPGNMQLVYTGKDPAKFSFTQDQSDPTIFKLTTTRADFHSDTKIEIRGSENNLLQSLKFHSSCSQPVSLGDVFGALTVVEFSTKDGGQFLLPDPEPPAPNNLCTIELAPPGPHCTTKPTSLTFRYLGGDCTIDPNFQDGRASCVGDPLGDMEPVRIEVTGTKKDADRTYLNTGEPADVYPDDIVTALASAGGSSKFGSSTMVRIYDRFDLLRQEIEFHTSCSKELNLGDRFGALELFGMDRQEGGPISLGAMIEYEYNITNNSGSDVEGVEAIDDNGTPGDPTDDITVATAVDLENGETRTFFERMLITKTTINTVRVTTAEGQAACTPATATVEVEEPPAGPQSQDVCATGKPFELVFEYVGESCAFSTTDQDGKFECVDRVNPPISGALPVQIEVIKKPDDVLVTTSPGAQTITHLDSPLITFTSTDGRLNSNTQFDIVQVEGTVRTVLQSLNIHTSCSVPLNVGDQFGAVKLIEFTPQQ